MNNNLVRIFPFSLRPHGYSAILLPGDRGVRLWVASVKSLRMLIVPLMLIPFSNTQRKRYKSDLLAAAWWKLDRAAVCVSVCVCVCVCVCYCLRWPFRGDLTRAARSQIQLSAEFRCCGWYGNVLRVFLAGLWFPA